MLVVLPALAETATENETLEGTWAIVSTLVDGELVACDTYGLLIMQADGYFGYKLPGAADDASVVGTYSLYSSSDGTYIYILSGTTESAVVLYSTAENPVMLSVNDVNYVGMLYTATED